MLLAGAFLIATVLPGISREDRVSHLGEGYLERARAMHATGNYAGAIDQLSVPDASPEYLPAQERPEALWILASSLYERGDSRCLEAAARLVEEYPVSPEAARALVLAGDFHFFRHEWPEALQAYLRADADRLAPEARRNYTYRLMLSQIKTGHYKEARPLVRSLASASGYRDAANFYTAYLDYIDGKFNRAYSGFSVVPENIPGLCPGYYMAQIEYTRKEYPSVISRCRSLLKSDPDPEFVPETRRILGLSLFKEGRYSEALPYLEKYVEASDNPVADALYALGSCLYEEGEYSRAAEVLEPLTDQRDEIGQGALLTLGQCELRLNDVNAAALAFEKAARLGADPAVGESALYNYAASLTRGGKIPFSSSAELLERFAKTYPDSEFASAVEEYLATAYYEDGNYDKALASINAVRHPDREALLTKRKVLYELGIRSLTGGKAAQAVKYLRECAALRSSAAKDAELDAESQLWLGDALYATKSYGEAAKAYRSFIDGKGSRDNRAAALYGLAYSLFQQGSYAAASTEFSRALDARPALPEAQQADARLRRADCLYYTGKYSDAAKLYSNAASEGGTGADYALYRGAVMAGLSGDVSRKLSLLERVCKEYPESRWLPAVLLEEAVTYEETGRNDKAADAYKRRLAVQKDVDSDELFRVAAAMHKGGLWTDLLEVTARLRRAAPLSTDELAELDLYDADALSHTGETSRAAAIYRQLAGTPSSLTGAKAAVAYGHMLITQRKYSEAEKAMLEFTEAGTPYEYWLARGFIILADAYSGMGEKKLARDYLESLRDNYPGEESDIADMISTRLKKMTR